MSTVIFRRSTVTAGILTGFAIVGTALLASTYLATKDVIAETEKKAKLVMIGQILPSSLYNNDILKDAAELPPAPELGNLEPTTVYRAELDGKPSAAVFELVAPDGYAGKIKMIMGVTAGGEITGVRVIDHHETPGLGDYIEIAKGDWIKKFDGLSLAKYGENDWKVRKDGGQFDHMAGATITPRAVVKAVHKALAYFGQNRDKIFSLPEIKEEHRK